MSTDARPTHWCASRYVLCDESQMYRSIGWRMSCHTDRSLCLSAPLSFGSDISRQKRASVNTRMPFTSTAI